MDEDEFAAWSGAIGRLSEEQRATAMGRLQALEATVLAGEAEPPASLAH
jgi:hypothetical protein